MAGRGSFGNAIHISSFVKQGVHLLVCNRNCHLLGNPKPKWHPARPIKERECVDLSMDTLHLKGLLVLFGSEGSALALPLFLLSPRIIIVLQQ